MTANSVKQKEHTSVIMHADIKADIQPVNQTYASRRSDRQRDGGADS